MKSEVKEVLARHGITRTTISVVQRSYAFEERGVPHGQQWVLKVKYPAGMGALPVGLSGRHFAAVFGVTTSLTESLIVRRTILGPSWMMLKNAVTVDASRQVSLPSTR
jgi:DNA polymerase alpha subunit A